MTQNDKFFIELAFNQRIGVSQRQKVKEFWHFFTSAKYLEPYEIPSDKKTSKEENTDERVSKLTRSMWHDQLKIFQKYRLDEAALTATGTCKLCETKVNYESSDFADAVQQPYEELLNDMKTFDEKSNGKTKN